MGRLLCISFGKAFLIERVVAYKAASWRVCIRRSGRSAICEGRKASKEIGKIYLHVKAQGFSKFGLRRSLQPKASAHAPLMTPQSLVPAVGFIFRSVADDARATSTILTFYTL